MSIEYRINVFTAVGGVIILSPSQPLFSVDEYSVAPDGNCLEATFRCVPNSLVESNFGNPATISVRDTIYIQTRPIGGTYTTKWIGYITLAGNPRSSNVETFRAVGLKQRFYEVVLGKTPTIPSQDVAAQAEDILDGVLASNSSINTWSFTTRDLPTLGFTAGRRYPLLETGGAALDALASSVGRFIVPTGETYTYDGVTFTAGQLVPPVTWGVRASLTSSIAPVFFFRRLMPDVATADETDLGIDVEWPAISGERLNTRPVIQYFPNMGWSQLQNPRIVGTNARPLTLPVAQPMIYSSISLNQAQAVVQLPNPSDFLIPNTNFVADPVPLSTFNNVANAFDGNSANAADGQVGNLIQYQIYTVSAQNNQNLTEGQCVVRLDVEYGDDIGLELDIGHVFTGFAGSRAWSARYVLEPLLTTGRVQLDLPVLPPVEFIAETETVPGGLWIANIRVYASGGPNGTGGTALVYDCRAFAPSIAGNNTIAESLVETYRVTLVPEATNVKFFSEQPIRTRIDLTPEVGSVIEVPVERVQYSITTAEGVTTTYHAGQPFDGELVSERVVLEGLARRAARS